MTAAHALAGDDTSLTRAAPTSRRLAAAVAGRAARFRADLDHAHEVQEQVLMGLLAAHAGTALGRAHGFASIRSIDDFRARVPIASYE